MPQSIESVVIGGAIGIEQLRAFPVPTPVKSTLPIGDTLLATAFANADTERGYFEKVLEQNPGQHPFTDRSILLRPLDGLTVEQNHPQREALSICRERVFSCAAAERDRYSSAEGQCPVANFSKVSQWPA